MIIRPGCWTADGSTGQRRIASLGAQRAATGQPYRHPSDVLRATQNV
jgi:hypothetical protein